MSAPRKRRNDTGRYAVLLVVFFLALFAVGVRLVWIQVVDAKALAAKATSQRMRDIEIRARRGTIYDREGEPLAVSVEARTIYASPNTIKDKPATAKAIADTIGGDADEYLTKLERDTGFVYLARKVDRGIADELEALELEGIGFIDDFKRIYPSGALAAQVLGFVGVDDDGLAGIEKQYDDQLAGKSGVLLGERDPGGRPIPGGVQKAIDPVHGHDIVLTIDKDIQYQAQVELSKAVKKWSAKSGTIIVMNPKTGEIYAMATSPGFNPNQYGQAKAESIRNKSVTDAYEPGSTLKCLTASAVIDKGYYTPDSMFQLPPTIRVGDRVIHESHERGAVRWSLTEIVTHSSNVGTVKLGKKLGKQGLYDSFTAFGLTERTGIDFPGEAKGWLPEPAQWSQSSIGNIPFGQGVSVTPMQLVRAVGAIANDGVLETPHLLLDMPQDRGSVPQWPTRRAIAAKTADSVTGILEAVVTDGTGSEARVQGFTVAGKTGTAQKAEPGKGYVAGKYVGSFIGYLPAEDPEIVVSVMLDEPRNAIYGGTVAAPTFAKVAKYAVEHLKILPPADSKGNTPDSDRGSDSVSAGTVKD